MVNLLLFRSPKRNFFVLADIQETGELEGQQSDSFFGRLRRKIHAAYDSLRERFDHQENVCAHLRKVDRLKIVTSESIDEEEARRRFSEFLSYRRKKHRKWLAIDVILALGGSLLTPIPGPNVFFFYPAARALSHYLAAQGADRARHIPMIFFQMDSRIDLIEKNLNNLDLASNELGELETAYGISRLRTLLERL